MSDKVYKNLGKIVCVHEKELNSNKPPILQLHFYRVNSQNPDKKCEYAIKGKFLDKIQEDLLEKVYSLSAGDEVCVHVGKDDNGYPIVIDISDAKDAEDSKKGNGKTKYKDGKYIPRDDSGIAVGAAWTNAIEIIKLTGDNVGSIEDTIKLVEETVAKILKSKLALEEKLRASKKAKAEVKDEEASKALSKAEEIKKKAEAKKAAAKKSNKSEPIPESSADYNEEPDLEDDDLDNVNWGE